jgi:hypothetical protein
LFENSRRQFTTQGEPPGQKTEKCWVTIDKHFTFIDCF